MDNFQFCSVSVVIPCYRCSCTIARAVASIASQTMLPKEIILVDDASGDETINTLYSLKNEYGDWLKVVALSNNVGAASARNVGWSAASQSYIAFLDADDTWHPQKIEIQYGYMLDNPDVSLIGHLCKFIKRPEAHSFSIQHKFSVTDINAYSLIFKSAFSTPSVMLRREISFRFNENQRYAEDAYLWQLIAFSGFKVVRIELELAFIHKELYGSAGLSSHMWQMELAELTNFLTLYKLKKISAAFMLGASVFSLVKFLRRLIIVILR